MVINNFCKCYELWALATPLSQACTPLVLRNFFFPRDYGDRDYVHSNPVLSSQYRPDLRILLTGRFQWVWYSYRTVGILDELVTFFVREWCKRMSQSLTVMTVQCAIPRSVTKKIVGEKMVNHGIKTYIWTKTWIQINDWDMQIWLDRRTHFLLVLITDERKYWFL